ALENTPAETENRENPPQHAESEKLSAEAQKILAHLQNGDALTPDALAELTALPFPLVSATLLLLELDRLVARKTDGSYEIL
ncbi:MAG: hypothetical protein IJF68_02510, partial [Opitutales bacterium]|nr:hypothetical protein [Opitutales bacterium]